MSVSFFFSVIDDTISNLTDNMGLICNQLEGKLNDEVINEDIDKTSNSLANSSKRRRKFKQFSLNPQHFLHNLFRWYFKSTSSLHDDSYTTPSSCSHQSDFGFSSILRNNADAEHDLVYREHKKAQTPTLTSQRNVSLIASKSESSPRSIRRRRSSLLATSSSSTSSSSSPSNLSYTNSHYYIRQSICLYAASSVILALCYLVTPSTAATDSASHPV